MTAGQLVEICGDAGLAHILVIVRRFLNVVYIIGPIVALAGLTYHLVKLVFSPDGKKNKQSIKNWLIAFLMLFLVPILINIVLGLLTINFNLLLAGLMQMKLIIVLWMIILKILPMINYC